MRKEEESLKIELTFVNGEIVSAKPLEDVKFCKTVKTLDELPCDVMTKVKHASVILVAQNSPVCPIIRTADGGYIMICR